MTLQIHPERFMETCAALMDGHVNYGFGNKASPLSLEPSRIRLLDCSGFVQYVLFRSCLNHPAWPGGSATQEEKCRRLNLRRVDYRDAGLRDDRLRIAFLPRRGARPRHVWFILNGSTLESHGGTGPNCRPWDTVGLASHVNACYEIGPIPPTCYGSEEGLFQALGQTSYGDCPL